jgi:hypothetical protein
MSRNNMSGDINPGGRDCGSAQRGERRASEIAQRHVVVVALYDADRHGGEMNAGQRAAVRKIPGGRGRRAG